ncbi:oligosaccharide flippase family protein [Tenacibaculum soleae]|uniref:oligosaccharide flippase family protein n=1 Tax=Tenacibaculum soleae TaxID=447689 RepID=UPI0026E18308|nr:oligosaccharide flippase family protein [Tenacibaculum soleae]MDO6743437.1 oligosaccharide flippase family protein [Tenacibaculum soleae]
MIYKIKRQLANHNKVLENFSYLAMIQFFNILLPLATYPYLIKVLGSKLYGEVIFAQTIATYFTIFIAYGFNISGAKDVALVRDKSDELNEVVSSIMIIKVLFWFISLICLIVSLMLFTTGKDTFLLYLFSFTICFNDLLFPQWFFQGIEKMKYSTIINLVIRGLFFVFIFSFIKEESQYLLVPLLNGIGALIGGGVALYIVFKKEKVKFKFPSINKLILRLKESFPLFASNVIISIKDRFNVIFIGMFLGKDQVVLYDLGVKLMNVAMLPINVVNNAIYPKMAIEKNKKMLKDVMKYSFLFYFIVILLAQPFIPYIVKIISEDIKEAVMPVRILLLAPIVSSLGFPLAHNGLVVFGKYKVLLIGMLLTTFFYLTCIFIGYQLNVLSSVSIFAGVTLMVYIFEFLYRYLVCKKLNIY